MKELASGYNKMLKNVKANNADMVSKSISTISAGIKPEGVDVLSNSLKDAFATHPLNISSIEKMSSASDSLTGKKATAVTLLSGFFSLMSFRTMYGAIGRTAPTLFNMHIGYITLTLGTITNTS